MCCSFSFCVIVGICPMTGEEKEKEGKKEKDLQWLQQMKARHNQNVKANQQAEKSDREEGPTGD